MLEDCLRDVMSGASTRSDIDCFIEDTLISLNKGRGGNIPVEHFAIGPLPENTTLYSPINFIELAKKREMHCKLGAEHAS